jgi:hypothetical protein
VGASVQMSIPFFSRGLDLALPRIQS